MKHKDHETLDVIMFGKSYLEVHNWLDDCWNDYAWGGAYEDMGSAYYHWSERHHNEAIREKYGVHTEEYDAAKLHVISDWLTHWGLVVFPNNKEEVIKLLDERLGLN